MGEGAVSAALGLAGVPDVSESTMIARDGALCLYEDARAHVQHLSARDPRSRRSRSPRRRARRLTAELTPHHLVLTDEAVRSLDARFKMNPPLRTEDDRQALIEALRSGVVDCIGTDHAPHATNEKEIPFEVANMGVIGARDGIRGSLHGTRRARRRSSSACWSSGWARARDSSTSRPHGSRPDAEANIVLVDLEAEWEAGADGWESRSENSCFTGRRLRSRPVVTIVAGSVAFRRREFTMKVAG